MRLLNVRLDDEDAKLVRALRDRGVSISTVVRQAIRAEAGKNRATASLDTDLLVREMLERFPTPARYVRSPRVNSADRRQVQELIRRKLGRRS